MIVLGSRYEAGTVIPVRPPRKTAATLTVLRTVPERDTSTRHAYWRESDRLDILGQKEYGSPNLWWQVLDDNPDILNPLALRAGSKVLLP